MIVLKWSVHLKNFFKSKSDGSTTYIIYSCGPDSLFQALCCLYIENETFKDLCIARKLEFKSELFDLFDSVAGKNSTRAHAIRNKLLSDHFTSEHDGKGLITINCESNMFYLIATYLKQIFPSVVTMKNCDGCDQNETKNHCVVEIDSEKLSRVRIQNLESCILSYALLDRESTCQCGGKKSEINHIGLIVFIDVQMIVLPEGKKIGQVNPVNIDDIPKTMVIKQKEYELKSLIHYKPQSTDGNVGHFMAICHFEGSWKIFDDIKTKAYPLAPSFKVLPHTLIYIQKM